MKKLTWTQVNCLEVKISLREWNSSKINKKKKLEEIRNRIIDPDLDELTFKPKLSEKTQNVKRTVNDLFNWKVKKEEHINRRKQEKEHLEMEEMEKTR